MHSIGSSVKRGGLFAGVVLTGLLLVATACGGGSKSSSSSDSNGSTATTVSSSSGGSSSGGGGSDASNCASLAKKFDEASAKMDSQTAAGMSDFTAIYKNLDALTSSVPSEIRGDWKVIVDQFKVYADAMNGIDMNNLTDPATMQKLTDAMAKLDSSKFETAMNKIDAYFNKLCPSYAGK